MSAQTPGRRDLPSPLQYAHKSAAAFRHSGRAIPLLVRSPRLQAVDKRTDQRLVANRPTMAKTPQISIRFHSAFEEALIQRSQNHDTRVEIGVGEHDVKLDLQ